MFLYSVLTYYQLVPEAFMADGFVSQEKLVQFAMSFMSKDAAAQWAERHVSAIPFPFPTWAQFEAEFRFQFVEENKQDQALTKLESHSYFQGSRDIYQYTDDFEELAVTAGYSDTLVWVTKYRSGLDLQINIVITTSRTGPDLTDYNRWRLCAFRQYEVFGRARTGNPPARLPAAFPRSRAAGVFPAPVPMCAPVTFALLAAPVLPAAVPMDVDRARTRLFPRTRFRCGAAGHLARKCPVPTDVRHTDVLDEVVRQLGDDLLNELFAWLSTSASLLAESMDGDEMEPAGSPRPAE
jgi:hypothetical protein